MPSADCQVCAFLYRLVSYTHQLIPLQYSLVPSSVPFLPPIPSLYVFLAPIQTHVSLKHRNRERINIRLNSRLPLLCSKVHGKQRGNLFIAKHTRDSSSDSYDRHDPIYQIHLSLSSENIRTRYVLTIQFSGVPLLSVYPKISNRIFHR